MDAQTEERPMVGSDDAIDLRAEFEATGLGSVFEELDADLIGLVPVKQRLREIGRASCRERVFAVV